MKKVISTIKNNKFLKFSIYVLKFIAIILLLMMLSIILVQKLSNNEFSLFGYRVYNVISGSMMPEYNIGDILISHEREPNDIKIGDNIVYIGKKADFKDKIVSHRVVDKKEENGKYKFITKGINNDIADPEINEDQILGVIVYRPVILSFIGSIMASMLGYFIICIAIIIIISIQIVKTIMEKDEEEDDEDEEII